MKKIFIYAGTLTQARWLAAAHDLKPSEWTYLDRPSRLAGVRAPVVWMWGTYYERLDYTDARRAFRERGCSLFKIDNR